MLAINKDIIYYLWFENLKKINNDIKQNIINNCKISIKEFFDFDIKKYIELGFDIKAADYIDKSKNYKYYQDTIKYTEDNGIDIICCDDDDYPEALKVIKDSPITFFKIGTLPKSEEKSIGIVGARKATEYGRTIAYKIAYDVSKKGIIIVSGMARGIDTCAHRGAIDAGGKTISVLGSGFKNIYPAENRHLMKQIIENSGCIITEYFPEVPPFPMNFPYRNRIISALSQNVLVVEAGKKSGSLITAGYALEQGKDVFAVPGNIMCPMSIGTNSLIKDGAKIVTCSDDVLEEYNIDNLSYNINNLDDDEKAIVSLLINNSLNIEGIAEYTGMDIKKVMAITGKLECKSIISRAYGGNYIVKY